MTFDYQDVPVSHRAALMRYANEIQRLGRRIAEDIIQHAAPGHNWDV